MNQNDELSRLMVLVEQYKEQLNQFEMQISYLHQAINDYNKAKISIENISKQDKNSDILMPIGGGAFIEGNTKNSKKFLIDIGAGYVVEKETNDALKKIEERIKELNENIERLNDIKNKTEQEATEVYQKAQKLYQEQMGQ